jgi:LTXXQ motif family protein
MNRIATQFTVPAARTVAAAAFLATLVLASPARAATGDLTHAPTAGTLPAQVMVAQATSSQAPATPNPAPAAKASKSKVDYVEARITKLHSTLNITPAQEDLWKNVTQVMRDNAQTMEALTKARAENATTMTAVEDLISYSELVDAHAAGLKKFLPAFEPLFASMSDAQRANANTMFRGNGRGRSAGKMMSKSHMSASPAASTK